MTYLTGIASACAAVITLLTIQKSNSDVTLYIVVAAMMILMFGYSVITITLKPSLRKYDDVLASLHLAIYEIRSLMTTESVSKDELQWSIAKVLQNIRELFELLSGKKCRTSILLITEKQMLIKLSKDAGKEYLTQRLFDLSAFQHVLEGEKCFIGSLSNKELDIRYATDREKLYRSLAIFPISKTEKPQVNIKKRIVVGFLVIDSNETNAFEVPGSSTALSENIYYRSGSAFADLLALLIPMFGKTMGND